MIASTGITVMACVACAVMAVRASRLIETGVWLAATSALLALVLYLLEAPIVAVIELSVGAGLVSVLVVFSVVGAGDDAFRARPALPRLVAILLAGVPIALLGWLIVSSAGAVTTVTTAVTTTATTSLTMTDTSFAATLWGARGLDALLQVALLFVAALGVRVLAGGLPEDSPVRQTSLSVSEPEELNV